MSIHTIGDSHSWWGWSGVKNHHLGAMLCYSFGRDKLARCDVRDFGIIEGDTLIFCLGEIDCRCHIKKYVNNSTSYEIIIDSIVNNYFEAIKANVDIVEMTLKNICVYNVVPTVEKTTVMESPDYPLLGSDDERKAYVLYFNKKIKEKCADYGYIFFDVYDKYIDERGFLRKDLSDGNVHIRDGIHIRSFIQENNI